MLCSAKKLCQNVTKINKQYAERNQQNDNTLWLWQKLTASSVMQMILFEFISGTLRNNTHKPMISLHII